MRRQEQAALAEPEPRDGWVTVDVRAAALNHHDLWSLRGVGLSADRLAAHSDIAPGRKSDPGPAFQWDYVIHGARNLMNDAESDR